MPDGRLRLVAKPLPVDKTSVTTVEECNSSNTTPLKIMSSAQADSSLEEVGSTAKVYNMQSESSCCVQQNPQDRKESGKGRPELDLPPADKQTSVTVATAVEKLFACLSPLRLQNKQRFSEKAVCNRQLSSEEAEEGRFMKSPTCGPAMVDSVAEIVHVSTACSTQFKDLFVLSGAGLCSPSQAEPICLSLPTDKQKGHSDKRSDESLHRFPIANIPDADVGHLATFSDQPDFHCRSQNSAWKEETCSETTSAGSLLVRQWPSSPKEDLTDEGIGNRHPSKTELGPGVPWVSGTAGPMTGCSNEAQGSRKRKWERSFGTVAVEEEASRKKGTS